MSRFRYYLQSVASGYVVLLANAVYTLGSVPLALHFLPRAEFGLWALATQVTGYIALIDFGMSAAVSRILIEYKDKPENSEYNAVLSTGLAVNLVQALIIGVCGIILAWVLAPVVGVPPELEVKFRWLIIWQTIYLMTTFVGRIAVHILTAHHRQDIGNYSQMFSLAINFAVLWVCFQRGIGLFSMVAGQMAGQLVALIFLVAAMVRVRLCPPLSQWGRPSRARFWELFAYSRDMFLYAVGSQLVNASQTILVSRMLGLEMGATWSVATRAFSLIAQIVYRVFDYSLPALAEMIVRKESERLQGRFRTVVVCSTSLAVSAGVMLFACNQPFVFLWTRGKIFWPSANDLLLGCWLVITVLVRSHTGLIGLTRQFRFLRYIYFLEGVYFVLAGLVALRFGGISAMIVASIFGSLLFSFAYSVRRNTLYFGISSRQMLIEWMSPSIRLALLLAPWAAVMWSLTNSLSAGWRLSINVVSVGLPAAVLFCRYGLQPSVREELQNRVFSRLSRLAAQKS